MGGLDASQPDGASGGQPIEIASTVGTAIECYGFFLHSTITGLVFATLFYPNSDPLVGRWKRSPPPP